MSGVKKGDRVRATCGENVIVGTASASVFSYGLYLSLDACQIALYLNTDDWSTEVIAPPIPDVVGTIVRDKNGDAWQRRAFGWYSADQDDRLYSLKSLPRLAPLTVLWTPEATS